MKRLQNICDLDFKVLDNYVLKNKKIKTKHITYPSDAIPTQGNPFLKEANTIDNILKEFSKQHC